MCTKPNYLTARYKIHQTFRLRSITTTKNTDYYLEVKSLAKEKKQEAMKLQFEKRFEEELQKTHKALHIKASAKKPDKVHERIGRAKERYLSVQQYYIIEVSTDTDIKLAT